MIKSFLFHPTDHDGLDEPPLAQQEE
ncbi:hypothetical protein Q604_UNBC01388G0001, partial [human gut metagenome]